MVGYIFEVTNKKTGATCIGKRYSVAFDKDFFGEEVEVDVEKYGKSNFEVKMIAPFESLKKLDETFDEMVKSRKPAKKAKVEEKEVQEEVKPSRKKKTTEEE